VTAVPVVPGGNLPLNSDLALSQSVTVTSPDSSGIITMMAGVRPTTSLGEPLLSLAFRRILEVPPVPSGATFSYAGYAYEVEPSGAYFDPYITVAITVSEGDWAGLKDRQLYLKWYNPGTSAWEDIPATIDPVARTVSARITHTSIFALFAENPQTPATTPSTSVPTTPPPSGGILSYLWILAIVVIIIVAAVIIIIVLKRRGEEEEETSEDEWKIE
jgi:hypothetical protein